MDQMNKCYMIMNQKHLLESKNHFKPYKICESEVKSETSAYAKISIKIGILEFVLWSIIK